jgi:hypothetical protein
VLKAGVFKECVWFGGTRTSARILQCVLLVGQLVPQGLEARALLERGSLREFLDLSFESMYMRLVLAHERFELSDVFFFRLIDDTSALCGLLTHVAGLFLVNR